jgi:hypothetical protein
MSRTISCTNGNLKDGKKTISCNDTDKYCFDNSYKYCKELSTEQIIILIVIGISGLIAIGILTWILNKIPIIGSLTITIINFIVLIIISVIIYFVYENYKAKKNN